MRERDPMTSKITEFDKPTLNAVSRVLDEALAGIDPSLGVVAQRRNCSYNANVATYKVEVTIAGGLDKAASDFIGHAKVGNIPFEASDLNKVFKLNGRDVSIVGYKPRARKHPIVVVALESGDRRVTSIDAAMRGLGKPIELTVIPFEPRDLKGHR
jgi:hypothetical protein